MARATLDWPRIRTSNSASRAWRAWAALVMCHRWIAAIVAVCILAVLAAPVASLRVGSPDADALAQTGSARTGLVELERAGLGTGVISPYVALTTRSPGRLARALSHVEKIRGAVALPVPSGARRRSRRSSSCPTPTACPMQRSAACGPPPRRPRATQPSAAKLRRVRISSGRSTATHRR